MGSCVGGWWIADVSACLSAALLKELRIAFFGVEHDGEIVAGCAANRSQGDVVGFSNFFALTEERDRFRARRWQR